MTPRSWLTRMLRYAARYTVYAIMVPVVCAHTHTHTHTHTRTHARTHAHTHTHRTAQVLTSLACNVMCQKVENSIHAYTAAECVNCDGLAQKPAVRLPVSTQFSSLLCLPCPSNNAKLPPTSNISCPMHLPCWCSMSTKSHRQNPFGILLLPGTSLIWMSLALPSLNWKLP